MNGFDPNFIPDFWIIHKIQNFEVRNEEFEHEMIKNFWNL